MSALAKWRPSPDSPIKPGYQCGNPKCQKVRGASNHWWISELFKPPTYIISIEFKMWSLEQWESPSINVDRVALCGEQCATELLNLWLSERTAEAMQGVGK